jgi:hypothetical protein
MLPAESADAQPAIVPLRHHLPPEGLIMPVIPRPFVSTTAVSMLGHRFTPYTVKPLPSHRCSCLTRWVPLTLTIARERHAARCRWLCTVLYPGGLRPFLGQRNAQGVKQDGRPSDNYLGRLAGMVVRKL